MKTFEFSRYVTVTTDLQIFNLGLLYYVVILWKSLVIVNLQKQNQEGELCDHKLYSAVSLETETY
jgi:hypothetical protein